MSDATKRKAKRKGGSAAGQEASEDPCKLTPDEEAVAKALLWEMPRREGKLAGMTVRIFFANEAMDFLMKSRFTASAQANQAKAKQQKEQKEPVIKDEKSAVQLMTVLLFKGLFQRAAKIQKDKRPVSRPSDGTVGKAASVGAKKAESAAEEEDEAARKRREEKRQKEREEKRKRGRPRLDIHEVQTFSPAPGEVYIWHYDPTRPRNVVLGFLMVLGSILVCLFPMWPLELRTGTYYLSIGALCLLGGLIGVALLRYPLFGLVWCLTWGRLHLWFLPNLTEDVGVLESFVPVISYNWAAATPPASAAAAAAASASVAVDGDKKLD